MSLKVRVFKMSLQPYLQKVTRFRQIIKANGGVVGSFLTYFRTDELKLGTLKGTDKFGNKYYESDYYFLARNRWVEYSPKFGWDYNASQIPPEWHRWMHHMCDESPVEKPPTPRKWIEDHVENKTGTNDLYVPYSTTKPKIESWQPPN